jgi:hypothetical protein
MGAGNHKGEATLTKVSESWVEPVLPLHAHDTGALTASGVGLLLC